VIDLVDHRQQGHVIVHTRDGQAFTGIAALVTFPLGVLKAGDITFLPALPNNKQTAISRLEFGTYDKIIMEFETPFWPEEGDMIRILPESDQDWNEYEQTICPNSDSASTCLPIPFRQRWNQAPERIGMRFMNGMKSIGHPIITVIIQSDIAKMIEQMTDDDACNFALCRLRSVFGQECVPHPKRFFVTRWHSDPFSKGSFTVIPIGACGEDMDALSEPVGDSLFFAGEATYVRHYSTIHGAYLSGEREASRMIGLLRRPSKKSIVDFNGVVPPY